MPVHPLLEILIVTVVGVLAGTGVLHLLSRLGHVGRRVSDTLCFAPWVDIVLFYFTATPWIYGMIRYGWLGLGASVVGQIVALLLWVALHEMTHPDARRGPRIYRTLDRIVGPLRNHLGLWWTAWVVPVFWFLRAAQWLVYPVLTWTIGLPKYREREWVNFSRHKFEGLVGYDLIWCLYCDWMTGVWSLATEMLRNVESYWCPIRFYSEKKCENCRIDFPDVDNGWVPADGTMEDVTRVLEKQYQPGPVERPWYGHPARLTVGATDQPPQVADAPPPSHDE